LLDSLTCTTQGVLWHTEVIVHISIGNFNSRRIVLKKRFNSYTVQQPLQNGDFVSQYFAVFGTATEYYLLNSYKNAEKVYLVQPI